MLNALIVDDEAPARRRLRKLLEPMVDAGRIRIHGEASDGFEALELLNESDVDLIFLDVKMPELDGFGLLERLEPSKRPAIVFTTAFDQYALRAFEANAVDYLLKPIAVDRLQDAVARAERMRAIPEERQANVARLRKLLSWLEQNEAAGSGASDQPIGQFLRQISIPFRDRILIIPVTRLLSAEIEEGITRLYLSDESAPSGVRLHAYTVSYTLDQLESSLDPEHFVRVHRSAIVQVDRIREMIPWFSGRFKLVLDGGREVVASRERSKQLRERLMF